MLPTILGVIPIEAANGSPRAIGIGSIKCDGGRKFDGNKRPQPEMDLPESSALDIHDLTVFAGNLRPDVEFLTNRRLIPVPSSLLIGKFRAFLEILDISLSAFTRILSLEINVQSRN
jgi:hypothetical protein